MGLHFPSPIFRIRRWCPSSCRRLELWYAILLFLLLINFAGQGVVSSWVTTFFLPLRSLSWPIMSITRLYSSNVYVLNFRPRSAPPTLSNTWPSTWSVRRDASCTRTPTEPEKESLGADEKRGHLFRPSFSLAINYYFSYWPLKSVVWILWMMYCGRQIKLFSFSWLNFHWSSECEIDCIEHCIEHAIDFLQENTLLKCGCLDSQTVIFVMVKLFVGNLSDSVDSHRFVAK
jgi:hypothetical protein